MNGCLLRQISLYIQTAPRLPLFYRVKDHAHAFFIFPITVWGCVLTDPPADFALYSGQVLNSHNILLAYSSLSKVRKSVISFLIRSFSIRMLTGLTIIRAESGAHLFKDHKPVFFQSRACLHNINDHFGQSDDRLQARWTRSS